MNVTSKPVFADQKPPQANRLVHENQKKKNDNRKNPQDISALPWASENAVDVFASLPGRVLAAQTDKATDCSNAACIAVTFDDGPDKVSTPALLDVLARHKAVATFYLIGKKATDNPDLVRRIYLQGNEVGNHSWSHPFFTKIDDKLIEDQVARTQQAIANAGVPAPTTMRPPYGAVNKAALDHIIMPVVLWNVDPHDWAQNDPAKIAELVTVQAKQGSILLLHDHAATAAAMDAILTNLQQRFVLVTVSQLLNLQPSDHGQFYSQYTRR